MEQRAVTRRALAPVYRMLVLPWLAWSSFLSWQVVLVIGIPAVMQRIVAEFREHQPMTLIEVSQEFWLGEPLICAWAICLLAAAAALVVPRALQRRQLRGIRLRVAVARSSLGWTYRRHVRPRQPIKETPCEVTFNVALTMSLLEATEALSPLP
jgi:hypothetical protein